MEDKSDYIEIIEDAERLGFISSADARELEKKAGALGSIGNYFRGGSFAKHMNVAKNIAIGLGVSYPVMSAIAEKIYEPIRKKHQFQDMLVQLNKRFPEISKTYSMQDITDVFDMLGHFSPALTKNPLVAASAVASSIDMPKAFDLSVMRNVVDIERLKSLQTSPFEDVSKQMTRAAIAAGIDEAKEQLNESLHAAGMGDV